MELLIHDISKAYDGRPVLKHLSLRLEQAPCYCLMSPSGSGKTTLLRILMGLEKPDCGTVCLSDAGSCRAPRICAVFQEDRLCQSFSPLENVKMAMKTPMKQEMLLKEMAKLLPQECLLRPVSTLSGGMKRRVAILRAMLAEGEVLLMDEPFTGLDEGTKQDVIQYILENRRGRFLLITTHLEEDAAFLGGQIIRIIPKGEHIQS